jgi:hypothetical protein
MLAPSVAIARPGVGTSGVTLTARWRVSADARDVSYVKDSTRENASSTQLIALVGYVDDSAKGTLDNRRSALIGQPRP